MSKNDGGPAAVVTMRDYFAAAALQGIATEYTKEYIKPEDFAKWCYQMADAMLAAREVM